jgi:predicted nucleic acid-binding protein
VKITDHADFKQTMWTDSYLAAFAEAGKHAIVTFDTDFQRFSQIEVVFLQDAPHPQKHS